MRDDLSDNDLKTVWQSQPTEPSVMTSERIREKVRELRAKTRRQLLGYFGGALAVAVLCGYGMTQFRVPGALFAIPIAWSLAGLYFLNRGMWPAAMPGDAALSTGLEFYRDEVERRRRLLGRVLLWSFGPVLMAMGTFILGLANAVREMAELSKALPFMTLVVVWIVGYFIVRMKEKRELQHEVEHLKSIEKESGR